MNKEQNKTPQRIFLVQPKTDGSVELSEGNFEETLNYAVQLCQQKRFEEGIYLLKVLARLRPNDPAVFQELAYTLIVRDQPESALPYAERLIQLQPDHAISYALMGMICQKLDRKSDATQALDKALAQKFTGIESFRAVIALSMSLDQRFSEAERLAQRVLEMEPNDPFTWLALGNIFRSQGKTDQALDAFKRVIKINPNSPLGQRALEFLVETKWGTSPDWSRN